ncbi:MAG: hypothetical protein LAT55_03805 [Opitutales bacterium]|nr:hypothetical protein [Opitutales bacterium]
MSQKKKSRFNRPPKKKVVGPSNNKIAMLFIAVIALVMVGLLGLYLANQF